MKDTTRIAARACPAGAILAFLAFIPAACTDLEAVRKFASTSAATADYRQVIADYAESPSRRQRYAGPQATEDLVETAKRRREHQVRLEAAQTILVKYMTALGDAAADGLPNVDDEIEGLTQALEGAGFVGDADRQLGKETATAAASLGKVLTRVVLDHWRQGEVAAVVREADPHVQEVVAGLKEVIGTDCLQSLESEELQVRNRGRPGRSAGRCQDIARGASGRLGQEAQGCLGLR